MTLALASLVLSALATTGAVQADLFTCQAEGGVAVSYSTTSLLGQPELNISQSTDIGSVSLINAVGNGIAIEALDDGSHLVSASTYIPDLSTTKWELALPAAQLADPVQTSTFTTTLNKTVTPTTIAGPLPGQTPTTTVIPATCEASFVAF